MEKELEDKKKMYLAVQNVLDSNANIWKGNSPLAMAKAAFDGKLLELNNLLLLEGDNTKDKVPDKSEVGIKLIETTVEISSMIQKYAVESKNKELNIKVNYTKSDLELSRDSILKDICQSIYNLANENIEQLKSYGLEKEQLSAYETLINEFDTLATDPLEPARKKHSERNSLSALMEEIDELIDDSLDKLMTVFTATHTDFYEIYRSARLLGEVKKVSMKGLLDREEPEEFEID